MRKGSNLFESLVQKIVGFPGILRVSVFYCEEKFKDDLMKDKEYMERDIFLFSLKDWMKSLIFKQKEEQNYEELINYCNKLLLLLLLLDKSSFQ